ncbi:hypothetical protein RclHR1_03870009 [Rhizophagus clarus]|uniref:Uncharacterized protein n=1 Tax=Rhizophagus clarus TaxID=94130 RepID=A0A2Z6S859_9GLOM|nr:hypothetical protein RclHR1_03870009 [Rhizophagus clarus]GET02034.1 hypothetical protein RCL_e16861_RclHR1_03870009 [Rhizophagus clarus]
MLFLAYETIVNSKLSLSADDDISLLRHLLRGKGADNSSCDTKKITCMDSEDVPSDVWADFYTTVLIEIKSLNKF